MKHFGFKDKTFKFDVKTFVFFSIFALNRREKQHLILVYFCQDKANISSKETKIDNKIYLFSLKIWVNIKISEQP